MNVKPAFIAKKRLFRKKALQTCDMAVVSFPKSGRTWVRNILSQYWSDLYEENVDYEFGLTRKTITHSVNYPRIYFTHNYFDYLQDVEVSLHELMDAKWLIHSKPAFLFRHPLDVTVSYFYHKKFREKIFGGSLEEFILSPVYGVERCCQFMLQMISLSDDIPSSFNFSYENLKVHPLKTLCNLLKYWEVDINENKLEKAVKLSAFSEMRKREVLSLKEAGNNQVFSRLRYGNDVNLEPNAMKVRKGIIAGYKDEISSECLCAIEDYHSFQILITKLFNENLL